MKISKFKEIDKFILNNSFSESYKNINSIMFILSIFGHFISIILSYFLLYKVIFSATESSSISLIISLILLSGLELLKRDFFDKFSFQYLKLKTLSHKDVYPLLIISSLIIALSFYASIKGSKEFSAKADKIENINEVKVNQYSDSVNTLYDGKIKFINDEISSNKKLFENKDIEQTQLQSNEKITSVQKERISDLKSQKLDIKKNITELDSSISKIKSERDLIIKEYNEKSFKNVNKFKNDNDQNSFIFVIISILVEIIILLGVYFNKYYVFRTWMDFKEKITNDSSYQKWILYDEMLNIIYNKNLKVNDKLPSSKNIIDILKINNIRISQKDITDFLKILNNIGITQTSGSYRFFLKTKDSSIELLKQHFNIE